METIADELRATGAMRYVSTTDRANGYLDEVRKSCTNLSVIVSRILKSLAQKRKPPILPETELAVEMQPPAVEADALWLLSCINETDLTTLQHMDLCTTKSDLQLFTCLKKTYLSLRSKVALARRLFLGLSGIHFVQVSTPHSLPMFLFISFSFSFYLERMSTDLRLVGFLL